MTDELNIYRVKSKRKLKTDCKEDFEVSTGITLHRHKKIKASYCILTTDPQEKFSDCIFHHKVYE
jgi:hypothetical protein